MRFHRLFSVFNQYKNNVQHLLLPTHKHKFKISNFGKCVIPRNFVSTSASQLVRIPQDETGYDDDVDLEDIDTHFTTLEGYTRDILYKNSKNNLIRQISSCASVQELFTLFEQNIQHYNCEHVTQTVLVLYDLLKIYEDFASNNMKNSTEAAEEFFNKLLEDSNFQKLLILIENKSNHFNTDALSYCMLYLNKLGLSVEATTMQLLCKILKNRLMTDFSLGPTSRFLETVFSEENLRPYFVSQELIPFVFKEIDSCSCTEDLYHLSVSLNKLNRIVTEENLNQYKQKVEDFLESGILKSSDYKVILQIISFLNYPRWRDNNGVLISKCVLLIKNNLNELTVNDLLLLYEIFFKIQEPGYILNDLQRCTYKYFHQLDDLPTAQKISLFSTILFFTAPHMRNEFQKKLKKYVMECSDYNNLLLLRTVLSYFKISDIKLCDLYWNKILKFLKTDSQSIDVINLSQHYINFNSGIDNYRHFQLEKELLNQLADLTKNPNYEFFPPKCANILNFFLLFGDDKSMLEFLTAKLEANWEQLRPSDCLKLAFALKIFKEMDKKYVKFQFARRINNVIDEIIHKEMTKVDGDLWKNNTLLKSCIYKDKIDPVMINELLENFSNINHMSSKSMENLFYCFLLTNSLIPEVLDNIVDYILTYKNHVLGFNVGRAVYLCYCLGYYPKRWAEFCETAVDVIIRDQNRMSGLLLIYSALALCFFNKLPNSLIRSIFNVEFMDKLDSELQQCYHKDKYPSRVRNYLMQLNRAVCLDYPECNVPWFHQKYVDEKIRDKNAKPSLLSTKLKETLTRIVGIKRAFKENVVTPYGYEIDFLLNLNSKNEIARDESECTKRLALLLIPEYAYTRIKPRLRGNFQLKRRHLEILGYKVIFVKFSDWIGLYYPEEKEDFLRNLIWPKKDSETNIEICR